jgi:hypothetical protein
MDTVEDRLIRQAAAPDGADDELDSDAGVRPDVEDRELVVDDGPGDEGSDDDGSDDGPADDGLTEQQRGILAFERRWWRHAGAKEQAIRDLFGVSSTRYYQMLNALLDDPAALAHDPVLVKRLRRLRATRARARTGR